MNSMKKVRQIVVLNILLFLFLCLLGCMLALVILPGFAESDYMLYFDGSDDYAEVSDAASLNFDGGDFTYAFWFRQVVADTGYIVWKGDPLDWYYLMIQTYSSNIVAETSDDWDYETVQSTFTFGWHFFVLMQDGTSYYLYIDDTLEDSDSYYQPDFDNSEPLYLASQEGSSDFWEGYLDDFCIFNRALNATERTYLYSNKGQLLDSTGLVLHFDFNEGAGSTLTDSSGQGNHGSLSGGPVFEYAYTVKQDSPSDEALVNEWTINFYYTVTFPDTPKNSCMRIFNNTDSNLFVTLWNTTELQSGVSLNYGSYTFSVEQEYSWDIIYYNGSDVSVSSAGNWTFAVDMKPLWQNSEQNATVIAQDEMLELSAEFYDAVGLEWAWLSTNETGVWLNYTLNPFFSFTKDYAHSPFSLSGTEQPHPSVLYFPDGYDGYKYWMYYENFVGPPNGDVRLSRSNDGTTWTTSGVSNPVVPDDQPYDSGGIHDVAAIYWNETFWVYYAGDDENGTWTGCKLATSSDGLTFTKWAGNPISGSTAAFNGSEAFMHNGTHFLHYIVNETEDCTIWLYTSTDGINWDAYGVVSPDFTSGVVETAWDYRSWDHCNVIEANGTFYLYWLGRTSGVNIRMGVMYSEDGYNFTLYSGNPIIDLGANGRWDDYQIYHPAPVKVGDALKLYYGGNGGVWYRVGLADGNGAVSWHTRVKPIVGSGAWVPADFIWKNCSVPVGSLVQYKVWANDTSGCTNYTTASSFRIVEKVPGTNFYLYPTNTANLISSPIYNNATQELSFIIDGTGISTTQLYCGGNGEPTAVTGATSYSYNAATQVETITVTHSSAETIVVDWSETAPSEYETTYSFIISQGFIAIGLASLSLVIGVAFGIVSLLSGSESRDFLPMVVMFVVSVWVVFLVAVMIGSFSSLL